MLRGNTFFSKNTAIYNNCTDSDQRTGLILTFLRDNSNIAKEMRSCRIKNINFYVVDSNKIASSFGDVLFILHETDKTTEVDLLKFEKYLRKLFSGIYCWIGTFPGLAAQYTRLNPSDSPNDKSSVTLFKYIVDSLTLFTPSESDTASCGTVKSHSRI